MIDRTEAMTVVDVNTGKFTGSGGNLEETVTKNNLEAAEEVVRQLRLRDIGGIIVIDFIDMVLESNRDLVLRRMVECLGRDRTKHQVAEVTSLGLVQMTRKRMGTGLLEVFGEQCETCAGRGIVTHDEPVEHRRANMVAAEHHVPRTEQPACRPDRTQEPPPRQGRPGPGDGAVRTRQPSTPSPPRPSATPRPRPPAPRWRTSPPRRTPPTCMTARRHQPLSRRRGPPRPPVAVQPESRGTAPGEEAAGRPAAVLTFGGEQVALPFVEHADEPAAAPALTLDLLTEAFAHLGEPSPLAEAGWSRTRHRRRQRRAAGAGAVQPRGARRAGRCCGTGARATLTTPRSSPGTPPAAPQPQRQPRPGCSQRDLGGTSRGNAGSRGRALARGQGTRPAGRRPARNRPASEPIILGVGVPASEL